MTTAEMIKERIDQAAGTGLNLFERLVSITRDELEEFSHSTAKKKDEALILLKEQSTSLRYEVDRLRVKLELARMEGGDAVARIDSKLERAVNAFTQKAGGMKDATEDSWEAMRDETSEAWKSLLKTLQGSKEELERLRRS